jgi:ATP-dependent HslUV protease ATP-binding subunit HslU
MEEISFSAPGIAEKNILIDRSYVQAQLRDILEDQDLRRFIL